MGLIQYSLESDKIMLTTIKIFFKTNYYLTTYSETITNTGPIKVNQRMAFFSGLKFGNLENEISVWVSNWELKTQVLRPIFENIILDC